MKAQSKEDAVKWAVERMMSLAEEGERAGIKRVYDWGYERAKGSNARKNTLNEGFEAATTRLTQHMTTDDKSDSLALSNEIASMLPSQNASVERESTESFVTRLYQMSDDSALDECDKLDIDTLEETIIRVSNLRLKSESDNVTLACNSAFDTLNWALEKKKDKLDNFKATRERPVVVKSISSLTTAERERFVADFNDVENAMTCERGVAILGDCRDAYEQELIEERFFPCVLSLLYVDGNARIIVEPDAGGCPTTKEQKTRAKIMCQPVLLDNTFTVSRKLFG